ncbi:Pyridoxal phosphate-dependent aminotransferase [Planctomycetales bacterium 10988]|nr:Pyridoxal phosphate-dependent aminotransferase [Planctomycetales bacterium 10988]
MSVTFSEFAGNISVETAFTVLAVAKQLKQSGKEVIELEIGDSPFPSTSSAVQAGIEAIKAGHTHYGPSQGLPEFRQAIADNYQKEHGIEITPAQVVVGPGAKPFELFFCEAFLNPGDGVLIFSPYFPTYPPNIARRQARMVVSDLKQETAFRPNLAEVEAFVNNDPQPKAIFLNSPHNPTGGITFEEDLIAIADLIRGKNIAVFSDEPYQHMVWQGKHHTLLAQPGMMDHCLAAYTFSKSYSMSGWRIGYAIGSPEIVRTIGNLINTSLSCVPPMIQLAAAAALREDTEERDRAMKDFQGKVELLVRELNQVPGVHCLQPGGTFYVFPSVKEICRNLGITSHGLAMYLLEAADEKLGVACLGGECFGQAGQGYLRFSCAEPSERLVEAVHFLKEAITRRERVASYLESHPHYQHPSQD